MCGQYSDRSPERFVRGDEGHRHLRHDRPQPLGEVRHPGLLRDHVVDDDQRLGQPAGDLVLHVLDQFPLARLADDDHVHVRVRRDFDEARHQARVPPAGRDPAHPQAGIAHDPHGPHLQRRLHVGDQPCKRRLRQREPWRRGALGVRLPAERSGHARGDAVGLHAVPVIVEVEDDKVVLRDERQLGPVGRVRRQGLDGVLVRIEGGLVRDHEVALVSGRALQHREGGHHRRGDAADGRVGPSGHDAIDGLGHPRNADASLDPIDDLGRGQLVGLRLSGEAERAHAPEELASCPHGRDSPTAVAVNRVRRSPAEDGGQARASSPGATHPHVCHDQPCDSGNCNRHIACNPGGQVNRGRRKEGDVYRIRMATVAALLASFVGLQATPARADDDQRRDRRDRYEERWDRRDAQRDWRNGQWDRLDARNGVRREYWDPARSYQRADDRNRPRAMGWNDQVYRGSDNRYYCKRDDGTTGLIVGGMAGGVLGHVIAPGGSKTLGTIIGAGAGALIGRAIDDGDIVCR